jgi:NAD(P)-dependent dehydrogenase (short-subunit alcohol dehydrogenase family)
MSWSFAVSITIGTSEKARIASHPVLAASKFALVGLSEGMRAELAKEGIIVTTGSTPLDFRLYLRERHTRRSLHRICRTPA